jgi:hypothetical protein
MLQAEDISKAAGVMQHLAERDGLAVRRKLGNVLKRANLSRCYFCQHWKLRPAPLLHNLIPAQMP